jgi:hypothetical protein
LDKYQKALKGGPICPQQAFQEPESVLAVGLSMESGGLARCLCLTLRKT